MGSLSCEVYPGVTIEGSSAGQASLHISPFSARVDLVGLQQLGGDERMILKGNQSMQEFSLSRI